MKKFFTCLMVSLIVVFLFSYNFTNDDRLYYWEGEKKHFYDIDTQLFLVEFTNRIEEQNLKFAFPEAETYRIKNDSTIQLITRSKSKLMARLSSEKNIIQYPAIRVKGSNGSSFITNEISIQFKGQKSKSDLKEFASKLGLEHIAETSYGAHLFSVPERTRTVAIANFIQENEQVVWSNPNFVNLISLFNDPLYPDQYYLQ